MGVDRREGDLYRGKNGNVKDREMGGGMKCTLVVIAGMRPLGVTGVVKNNVF